VFNLMPTEVAQALRRALDNEIREQNLSMFSVDEGDDAWVKLRGPGDTTFKILCEAEDSFRWHDNPGSTRGGWPAQGVAQPARHSLLDPPRPQQQMWRSVMEWLATQSRYAT
jgi:hypothetical protein